MKSPKLTFIHCLIAISIINSSLTYAKTTKKLHPIKKSNVEYIKKENLYSFYNSWKGTRYRLGGTTKRGVDCSSLVQHFYKEKYALKLPRTTLTQAQRGERITSKKDWKVGDLVFFKINRRVKHVGIYVGNNRFLHSGSSTGVTISRLDDAYWAKRHWQTRRIMK